MSYRPSLLITASLLLHGLALIAVLVAFSYWPYVLAALFLNHLLLTLLGLWPRSTLLGRNITRLPTSAGHTIALTIDDGPDPEVTPKVLDLLDELKLKANFFVIGERVRAHPALCAEIIKRGHDCHNHSDSHSYGFAFFLPTRLRQELILSQAAIFKATGTTSRLFRAPAGLRNPLLDYVLQSLGLTLVAWTRRGFDTLNKDATKVGDALCQGLVAGDILLLHDGRAARTSDGTPVILAVLPRLAQTLDQQRLTTTLLSACLPSRPI